MSFFTALAEKYHFTLKEEPIPLTGGLMHKMYRLSTDRGDLALKVLNGEIMKRPAAPGNFAQAERLEAILEERRLPIVPAMTLNGRKMQEMDGAFFYLYDYYPGKQLRHEEITEYHCAEIGKALAAIHAVDWKTGAGEARFLDIDWEGYLEKSRTAHPELHALLSERLQLILQSQEDGNRAGKLLPRVSAICHNDMDCKNVLWNGRDFRIIDLECLSYQQPMMEVYETALCWAGYEEGRMDFGLFQAFLRGYAENGGALPTDWETLYACNNGRLEWLEYSVKRALGLEGGEEEKALGLDQARQTLGQIALYAEQKERILAHCPLSIQ